MAGFDAVLFDYGGTLVTFEYPTQALLEVIGNFRPTIEEALGGPAPSADVILNEVLLPLERHVSSSSEEEVDWLDVYRAAWDGAGLQLPDGLLYEILDAEQRCWDRVVQVDPDGLQLLSWLGANGVKRAVCSNAPFPPEMMRRQVAANGIGDRTDAVVFSSEVGRRKPAPEVYRAALDALSVLPTRTLFVGDRVREDYDGPRALGMHAVICTRHAAGVPPHGIPTIAGLGEVRGLL